MVKFGRRFSKVCLNLGREGQGGLHVKIKHSNERSRLADKSMQYVVNTSFWQSTFNTACGGMIDTFQSNGNNESCQSYSHVIQADGLVSDNKSKAP